MNEYFKKFFFNWWNASKKELDPREKARKDRNSLLIFIALVVLRFFFIDWNFVPSASMTPTLLHGDLILVKKYAYSWSRLVVPWGGHLPFFKKGIVFNKPKKGDIVVFILSRDPRTYYVKRIAATSGDTVQMKNGLLHVNNIPVERKFVSDFSFKNDSNQQETGSEYAITLPYENNKTYRMYRHLPFGQAVVDNTPLYVVPEGHVWLQGDYNTGSRDSFDTYFMGPLSEENLVGKVFCVALASHSRLPDEPNLFLWVLSWPKRILIYLFNLDFSRLFTFVE